MPIRLRWAISWMRSRHMPRGRNCGCGTHVALRALLLHGLDERRVGQRVGLAVEAEDRPPAGGGAPAWRLGGAEDGEDGEPEEDERRKTSKHARPVYNARPRAARGAGHGRRL